MREHLHRIFTRHVTADVHSGQSAELAADDVHRDAGEEAHHDRMGNEPRAPPEPEEARQASAARRLGAGRRIAHCAARSQAARATALVVATIISQVHAVKPPAIGPATHA